MISKNYRSEVKFIITVQEAIILKNLLSCLMQKDKNSGASGGYSIRSLYFDTLDNRDFHEKGNGLLERRKIRLRSYSPEAPFLKLEIKSRNNRGILKETAVISRPEAMDLISGETDFLLSSNYPAARQVYSYFRKELHRPAVIIDYEREAFTLPVFDTRITFDSNIRGTSIIDISIPTSRLVPLYGPEKLILEVKYTGMLPAYLRSLLGCIQARPVSFSKYYLARAVLL